MHNFRVAAICGLILSVSAGAALAQAAGPPPAAMTLTSTSFVDGGNLADKNTAVSAKPVSPQLSWANAPAGTVSFALIAHDLDAVTGKSSEDHLHWGIFNIPASVNSLAEGQPNVPQLPDGSIQIKSSAPFVDGYRGPAFRGVSYHHYAFQLYALDTKLSLGPDATRPDMLRAMDGHILSMAADMGLKH
jgi:Raf kinase inhibitor-like YbhB/YbcL family protein